MPKLALGNPVDHDPFAGDGAALRLGEPVDYDPFTDIPDTRPEPDTTGVVSQPQPMVESQAIDTKESIRTAPSGPGTVPETAPRQPTDLMKAGAAEPAPTGTVPKKRNFFQNMLESYQRGDRAVDVDLMGFKAMSGEVPLDEFLKTRDEFKAFQEKDPVEAKNWASKIFHGAAKMAPGMIRGTTEGIAGGLAAAGITAAAGQAGPQALAPEEVFTVPAAYALGSAAGGIHFWARQGAGQMFGDMLDAGISPSVAAQVAGVGGPIYAVIEYSQVGKIAPTAVKGAKAELVRGIKEYLKDTGEEVGEEVLQQAVQIGARHAATSLSNNFKGTDVEYTALADDLGELKDIAIQSVGPMALLLGPTHGARAVGGIKDARQEAKRERGLNDGLLLMGVPPEELSGMDRDAKVNRYAAEYGKRLGIEPEVVPQPGDIIGPTVTPGSDAGKEPLDLITGQPLAGQDAQAAAPEYGPEATLPQETPGPEAVQAPVEAPERPVAPESTTPVVPVTPRAERISEDEREYMEYQADRLRGLGYTDEVIRGMSLNQMEQTKDASEVRTETGRVYQGGVVDGQGAGEGRDLVQRGVPEEEPESAEVEAAREVDKQPWKMTQTEIDALYPIASERVDDRVVGKDVPNLSSISSSVENSTELSGIREVPMSAFDLTGKHYSAEGQKRIDALAAEIASSGRIDPLIVVLDEQGPYILEGATRADALKLLGAKSFPAKIVLDEDALYNEVKRRVDEGQSVPPAVLTEYPDLQKEVTPVEEAVQEGNADERNAPEEDAEEGVQVVEPGTETPPVANQRRAFIDRFKGMIESESIDNPKLNRLTQEVFGQTLGNSREAYDSAEAALNEHIQDKGLVDFSDDAGTLQRLSDITSRMPRQTTRTTEQIENQQFSTPPVEAYVVAKVAGIQKGMDVLEPSAGTGNIATMAKIAGANVMPNEIAERRLELLRELGYQPTNVNAEQLDNLYPEGMDFDVVVMNPPFSATGGRVAAHKTEYGARHVEQALRRLKPGGRLVAIVGRGMAHERQGFADWWKTIESRYNVRANIGMSGKAYGKFGTTFDNQILVIDNTGPTPGVNRSEQIKSVIRGEGLTPEQALDLLKPVSQENVYERVRSSTRTRSPEVVPQAGSETRKGGTPANPPTATPSVRRPGRSEPATSGIGQDAGQRPVEPVERPGERESEGAEPNAPESPGPRAQVATEPEAGRPTGVGGGTPGLDAGRVPDTEIEQIIPPTAAEKADEVYSQYIVQKARVKGATHHPGNIVESSIMASVESPDLVTHNLHLPEDVIKEGRLSDIALEAMLYAEQRWAHINSDGTRSGFWIGDGTDVGKGREIYGLIYNQYMQGRKKAVHISATHQLAADANRDKNDVGLPMKIIHQKELKRESEIATESEGVLFTTYSMLRDDWKSSRPRFKQLIDWLGKDFDGVIAFDEAHSMKNAVGTAQGGVASVKAGSDQGAMGLELQKIFPNARIVYVSATGATTPLNLGFMSRLGLWGPGAPFSNFIDFLRSMQGGGVNAMEMLARDLKAVGAYLSRVISYKSPTKEQTVEYQESVHNLTEQEKGMYQGAAQFWQRLLTAFEAAANTANAPRGGSRYFSQFYSTQQRFFLQMMTSFQVDDLEKAARKDLEEGRSIVINLYSTNEQAVKRRAQEAMIKGEDIDALDMTPRQMLIDLVERHFPIHQYEDVTDPITNVTSQELVTDANGNPVFNRENLEAQQEMIRLLSEIALPDNPLDGLINRFGAENVAEISGRKKRIEGDKYVTRKIKGVPNKKLNEQETALFQDGKKRIAIITGAATTGISLHSDNRAANKQRRSFYAMQLSWSADQQMQAFGRVHRSNQANAPIINLVRTDLAGQKRLINAISRRLAGLGAITRGTREALGGSLFDVEDITDQYGEAALAHTYGRILRNRIQGITAQQLTAMGVLDNNGNIQSNKESDVDSFLNRIMVLPFDTQNSIFEEFYQEYQRLVSAAKENGTFDTGVEVMQGSNLTKTTEEVVRTDTASGAKTKLVVIEGTHVVPKIKFKDAVRQIEIDKNMKPNSKAGFYRNQRSGKIYIAETSMSDPSKIRLVNPRADMHTVLDWELKQKFDEVTQHEAGGQWEEELSKIPNTEKRHSDLLTGAVFPIYDKISRLSGLRVYRAILVNRENILGIYIPPKEVASLKQRLGVGPSMAELPALEIFSLLEKRAVVELDNGWRLRMSYAGGEDRIEIDLQGKGYGRSSELTGIGATSETIEYKQRWFVSAEEEDAVPVLEKLFALHKPIRDITSAGPSYSRRAIAPAAEEKANVTREEAEAELEKVRQKWTGLRDAGGEIFLAESEEEVEAKEGAVKKMRMSDKEGFFGVLVPQSDGTVRIYVVLNGQPSAQHVTSTAIHEAIGHWGVEVVIGKKQHAEYFHGLAMARRREVKAHADSIGLPFETRKDRILAAREFMADRVARDLSSVKTWYERLKRMIRNAIYRITGRRYSDAELDTLTRLAVGITEGTGVQRASAGGIMFSMKPHKPYLSNELKEAKEWVERERKYFAEAKNIDFGAKTVPDLLRNDFTQESWDDESPERKREFIEERYERDLEEAERNLRDVEIQEEELQQDDIEWERLSSLTNSIVNKIGGKAEEKGLYKTHYINLEVVEDVVAKIRIADHESPEYGGARYNEATGDYDRPYRDADINIISRKGEKPTVTTREGVEPEIAALVPKIQAAVDSWRDPTAGGAGGVVFSRKSAETEAQPLFSSKPVAEYVRTFIDGLTERAKNQRPELKVWDRILRTIEYYADRVPALKRVLDAAEHYGTNLHLFQNYSFTNARGGDDLVILKSLSGDSYKHLSDYIVQRDIDALGYRVHRDGENQFSVYEPGSQEPITTTTDEQSAWTMAYLAEAGDRHNDGWTSEEIQALLAYRGIMHRDYELFRSEFTELEKQYETQGMEPPKIGDISIFDAMREMGDLRGSYFPRLRGFGKFKLWASKDGEPSQLLTFKTKLGMSKKRAELIRDGWTVPEHALSTTPSHEVFGETSLIALNDLMQSALVDMKSERASKLQYEQFDMKAIDHEYTRKDGTKESHLIVVSPRSTDLDNVFKSFDGRYYGDGVKTPKGWHFVSPSPKLKQTLLRALWQYHQNKKMVAFGQALAEELAEMYLGRGSRSRQIGRSGATGEQVVRGYETDLIRATVRSVTFASSGRAKRIMAKQMYKAITGTDISWDEFKSKTATDEDPAETWLRYEALVAERRIDSATQERAYKDATEFAQNMLRGETNAENVMGTVRGAMSIHFLAGFAAPAVNMTALVTNVPAAAKTYGDIPFTQTLKNLAIAGKEWVQFYRYWKRGKGNPVQGDDAWALDEIAKRGWAEAQMNIEATEALMNQLDRAWSRILDYAMWLFRQSEQVNRAATILGSYRSLRENHKGEWDQEARENAIEKAKHISDRAHGVYGKINLPAAARSGEWHGQIVRSAYTYLTFSHNYLQLAADAGFRHKDAKATAWLLLTPPLLAGAGASVLAPFVVGAVKAVFKAIRQPPPDDPWESFYAWLEETFGSDAARFARFGAAGLAGLNIKGSLGIDITAVPTDIRGILGAPYALGENIYRAVELAARGDYGKAVEKIGGRMISAPLRAYREFTEGVSTPNNVPVFYGDERLRADLYSTMLRSLSFNPADLSEKTEKQFHERKAVAGYSDRREPIRARFLKWYGSDEQSKAELLEIQDKIEQFNARVRRNKPVGVNEITDETIRRWVTTVEEPPKRERERFEDREYSDEPLDIEDALLPPRRRRRPSRSRR